MKPIGRTLSATTLLRAAAVVSVFYCAGHASGYPWTSGVGPEPENVARLMQSVSFETMGVQRTYADFYVGFGHVISAFLLTQSAWLWSLASIAKRDARLVIPAALATLGGVLVNAYLSYRFFFALPAMLSVVIALFIGAAAWVARGKSAATDGAIRTHATAR